MSDGNSSGGLLRRIRAEFPTDKFRNIVRHVTPGVLQRHYAAKFIVALLVVTVMIAGVGTANYLQAKDTVENDARNQVASTAALQADSLGAWSRNMQSQTRTMSVEAGDRESQSEVRSYLSAASSESKLNIRGVHFVDVESGGMIVSTDPAARNRQLNEIDQPWASTGALSDIWYDEAPIVAAGFENGFGERLVAFASPLPGSQSKVVVVVGSVDSWLQDTARPSANHSIMVVDSEQGTPVTSTENRPEAFSPTSFTDPGNETAIVQGGSHLFAYTAVPETDWVLVSGVPTEQAFAVREAVGLNVLLTGATGVLALALVGIVLGQQTIPPLVRLRRRANRMEEGDLNVDLETRRRDEIGRLYGAFASMRDSLREQIEYAETARTEAERERERAEDLSHHLVEKADKYSQVMRDCADGDLTRRMDSESRNEAMAEIAVEFNEMIEEIESTTRQVKDFAGEVATSSEEVTASSEEVKGASEQVTESVQEISDGAERQNEQLQSVASEMDSLSTTIEEIASSATEVADLSQQTAETGDSARAGAEQAIDEMETVEREAEATVAAMADLQTQMQQIEEITEFITDVAEQTNILALNANIEAARAGEAGEGFAVVADEVKSLAEDTRAAAGEIDQLVETLRDQTETTAEEVRQTSDEVARSTDIVADTVDALEEIARYAEETNTGIQGISDATTEQASSTNQVVSMVDEATSISEQTSNESGNVAAAAEEQTTALTEVTDSASDLAEQASQLSSALERFETGSGDDKGYPGDVDAPGAETVTDGPSDGRSSTAPEVSSGPGDEGDEDPYGPAGVDSADVVDTDGIDVDDVGDDLAVDLDSAAIPDENGDDAISALRKRSDFDAESGDDADEDDADGEDATAGDDADDHRLVDDALEEWRDAEDKMNEDMAFEEALRDEQDEPAED